METQDYNGWTNRETWATMLHIDNDQALLEIAMDYARQELEGHDEGEEINPYYLGETLESWFDDMAGDFTNLSLGVYEMLRDIGSLDRVNWREIAETLIGYAKEEKVGA